MDLKTALAYLTSDKRLHAHMNDAQAAIWLHAAGEHLRQTAREGGDIAAAYAICQETLFELNARLAERREKAIERLMGSSTMERG